MTHLREGDRAPAFSGNDQFGNEVSLAGYKGQKIVLYFYPQDDTPTCTTQACNLRDNYALLTQHDFIVVGVSPDDESSHRKFAAKYQLPFILIADPKHTIINRYSVWGEKVLYGRRYQGLHRTTFVIDEEGIIIKVFFKPRSRQHAEDIIRNCRRD